MRKIAVHMIILAVLFAVSLPSAADKRSDAYGYVDNSLKALTNFANDPNMQWFRKHVRRAKGILIIPTVLKAGFIFGGSGGTGVLLRREASTGWSYSAIDEWSCPAFYSMGSVTFGLQIGGEAAEVILLVMTQRGMDAMLTTKAQLGADMSIAAGPVGAGAQAATVDILQFSRSKGVFGGLTVEGSIIEPRGSLNKAYYGKTVSPLDILVRRTVSNAHAYRLRAKLASLH